MSESESSQMKTSSSETSPSLEERITALEDKVIHAAGDILTIARAENPDLRITHQDLRALFDLTEHFYSAVPEITDYLMREAHAFSKELRSLPHIKGTFGLGYPFYALTDNLSPVQVEEIMRFLRYTNRLLNDDASRNNEWICPACQRVNRLPDLKSFCKPCDPLL